MKHLFKFYYYLVWFSILMGIILISLVTYWMNYPYKPLVFNTKTFPVKNIQVKRGDVLFYSVDYCKYTKIPAKVTRSFINSIIYVTPTTTTDRPTGCHEMIIGALIPKELPPGEYLAQMVYEYKVNPIRTISITMNTDKFMVVE